MMFSSVSVQHVKCRVPVTTFYSSSTQMLCQCFWVKPGILGLCVWEIRLSGDCGSCVHFILVWWTFQCETFSVGLLLCFFATHLNDCIFSPPFISYSHFPSWSPLWCIWHWYQMWFAIAYFCGVGNLAWGNLPHPLPIEVAKLFMRWEVG